MELGTEQIIEYDYSKIPRSVSCNTTPCNVHSPIPIRTPKISSLSFGFVLQKTLGSEFPFEGVKKATAQNQTDRKHSKKLFALAKEDLESENKQEFFPRVTVQENPRKSQPEIPEEENEMDAILLPTRVSNPQVLDKRFNIEATEPFGIPPRNFQFDLFGETA